MFRVLFLFDAVGFPDSVRARHFVDLSEQLEKVFSSLVENETRVRDEYRTNVLALQKQAERIEKILAIPNVPGPKQASLMALFDFYNRRVEDLSSVRHDLNSLWDFCWLMFSSQQRSLRYNEIMSYKSKLNALQHQLAEGDEFIFSEEDMSPEIVRAVRAEIVDAEHMLVRSQ